VQHINAEFGFEIGLWYREFICDTSYTKDNWGVTTATNFGTKIAINAFSTRGNENVITYNGVLWSANAKKDISDCKVLRDIAMAAKF